MNTDTPGIPSAIRGMTAFPARLVRCVVRSLALPAFACAATASAQPAPVPAPLPSVGGEAAVLRSNSRWYFQTSAFTRHFDPKPHHNNAQRLLNVEWQGENDWILGGAYFYNSFDQPSQYVYGGYMWRPFDDLRGAYFKLTGGLVHGYKGEHKDNIPFNGLGVAPALLPSIGISGKRFATELVVFGTSGVTWNVGFYFR